MKNWRQYKSIDQWIPDMVKHRNFTLVFISIVFHASMKLLSYEQFHDKGNIEMKRKIGENFVHKRKKK